MGNLPLGRSPGRLAMDAGGRRYGRRERERHTGHSYGDVFGGLKVQGTHPGTWVALTSTTGVGRRVRVGIAAPEGV